MQAGALAQLAEDLVRGAVLPELEVADVELAEFRVLEGGRHSFSSGAGCRGCCRVGSTLERMQQIVKTMQKHQIPMVSH